MQIVNINNIDIRTPYAIPLYGRTDEAKIWGQWHDHTKEIRCSPAKVAFTIQCHYCGRKSFMSSLVEPLHPQYRTPPREF